MSIPQSSSTELWCRHIGKSPLVTIFPRVMCNQVYLELCNFMGSSQSRVRSYFQTYSVPGKVRQAPLSGYVISWILKSLTKYDTVISDEDERDVYVLVGVAKRCWNGAANVAFAKPAAGTVSVAPPVALFVELSSDHNKANRNLTFYWSRCRWPSALRSLSWYSTLSAICIWRGLAREQARTHCCTPIGERGSAGMYLASENDQLRATKCLANTSEGAACDSRVDLLLFIGLIGQHRWHEYTNNINFVALSVDPETWLALTLWKNAK
jgi:hypothetical protein